MLRSFSEKAGALNLIPFDSYTEMQEFLRKANAAADQKLHPLQAALHSGDCWVRFLDLPMGMVEFGKILTWQQVYDTEVEAGANTVEARQAADSSLSLLSRNYVYGRAWSPLNRDGEYGVSHKSALWPIECEVVSEAVVRRCQVDLFSLPCKINLEHAFRALRGHLRSNQ